MDADDFIARWYHSEASERANKDSFLKELCRVLGVPEPNASMGDPEADLYVFERDAFLQNESGRPSVGKMDLYKHACFILEAKQGSTAKGKKSGTARRDTPGWHVAMSDAFGQALKYARTLDDPPPFLIACDIGYCFDIYACFDGSTVYRPFPNAQKHRIYLRDLDNHADALRAIWLDPKSLDPQRHAERITRDLAESIAKLAVALEGAGHDPHVVAKFLMRCLFTMFAEDIGLLTEKLFTKALEKQWIPDPNTFVAGVEELWDAMNGGKRFWFLGKLLHFNGGLFANPVALPLDKKQLELLHRAALRDWANVEPSIFGTLLERALDPEERHRLGAHFTPRSYVQRLLGATLEQPVRAQWEVIRGQVRQLVPPNEVAKPTPLKEARTLVRAFHKDLCETTVLDPACGTGNFLYVALDIFKRIESEILRLAEDLGESQRSLEGELLVTPKQFLGIEVRPWAKEIAELVLWIGYLQWHHKTYGKTKKPPEPVLKDYRNIECKDALLVHGGRRAVLGRDGKPVTRWDGHTKIAHPVTGKDVPDDAARVPVEELVNPRPAQWPYADYIVGNPPFVGNKRMRLALTDAYVEALRAAHVDVPETADYVMFWWNQAAKLVSKGAAKRLGFITTNKIHNQLNRGVVDTALKKGAILFAIPDHPWVDEEGSADVRIAMTVYGADPTHESSGVLATLIDARAAACGVQDAAPALSYARGRISSSLRIEAESGALSPLRSNSGIAFQGVIPLGDGFRFAPDELETLGLGAGALPPVVRRFTIGRDLVQHPSPRYIIDFFGLSEREAAMRYPRLYQRVLTRVKPERDQNRRSTRKEKWWLFGENAPKLRQALKGLRRFIGTPDTSKHKPFVFLDADVLPDVQVYAIASDDAFVLGVLSSRIHQAWLRRIAPRMGVGNDIRWKPATVFAPFPFPLCDSSTVQEIRELGERIDAHRKARQQQHPELTLTAVYNVLEQIRAGIALSEKERMIHEQGLVSVLSKLHDDLDAAVLRAYGWSRNLGDAEVLERLEGLNRERAQEERRGVIHWLREELQRNAAPSRVTGAKHVKEIAAAATMLLPWPEEFPRQVTVVRDLFERSDASRTSKEVAEGFAGATVHAVVPALETLAALGIVAAYGEGRERRWKGLAKAGGTREPAAVAV